jgi:transcriptional antiterminator NusG
MAYKWYFVRCQSGREDSIRKQLETRIQIKGLQDVIPQVLVPFERVTDLNRARSRPAPRCARRRVSGTSSARAASPQP